jgi:hypothetical protein
MKNTKTALLAATLVALAVGMTSPAASQDSVANNGTDNSTVVVSVAEKTAVDISPDKLNYLGIDPGSVNATATDGGDESYDSVEIENIGSTNITHVWFNASVPADRPFGTGVPGEYNAGNFIQVKPTGDKSTKSPGYFSFVNRKEFSTSNIPEYVFREDNTWEIGRFRVADQEYFWAAQQGSADGTACSTGTDTFRVGNAAHNKTATGSNDFRNGAGEFSNYDLSDGSDGDAGDVVVSSAVNISGANYRVEVDCDPGTSQVAVTRSRYNPELAEDELTSTVGNGAEFVLNETASSSSALQPGEHFNIDTRVSIPQGVAQGSVTDGFLRVLVNTQ